MKLYSRNPIGRIASAILALTLAASATAQNQTSAANRNRVVLPEGAVIPVRLDTALSSKYNRPGDRFTATVRSGTDDAGMPAGTRIEGTVREAIPSGNGKPGVLDVDFSRVVFPNGDTRTLTASLVSLDNKSVQRSDGHLVATRNNNNDRLKFIGIGAGAGLLIGTLTKQNSLLSTILGAGGGYLFSELQGKKPSDVNLKEGSEFGVRFDRQFAFNSDHYPLRTDYQGIPEGDRYYHRSDQTTPVYPGRTDYNNTGDIGVIIDDRNVDFRSAHPIMRGSTVLIPLRQMARAGGFDYGYDAGAQMVRARNGSLRLAIGSRIAVFNGERRRMDAAAEVRNGTVYVPMQFVALATGGSASWDATSRTVVITTQDRYR